MTLNGVPGWGRSKRCLFLDVGDRDVVVESSDIDADALDPDRRSMVLAAFSRLCRALEMPLQISILTRRLAAPGGDDLRPPAPIASLNPATAGRLTHGRATHWSRVEARRAAFTRRIVFAVRAAEGSATAVATTRELVLTCLRTAGIAHRDLATHEARALVRECASMDDTTVAWREPHDHARIGRSLLHAKVLSRLPGDIVRPGWLRPLLAVRAEHDVTIHLRPFPRDAAIRLLSRRLRGLRSTQLLRADRGTISDASVDSGASAAHELRGRLAANHSRPLLLTLAVTARAHDRASLADGAALLATAFRACLAGASPAHFRHLAIARSCWPLGPAPAGGKLVDSEAATTCLPWVHTDCNDPHGYRLGRALDGDRPVQLEPFATSSHPNANMIVLARSGQGKSYTMGTVLIEAALRGVPSIVIDPEGEYGSLVAALGGNQVTVAPGTGTALNIFDTGGHVAGDTVPELQARIGDLLTIIVGERLGIEERALLDSSVPLAIADARAEHRTPVLRDCLRHMPEVGRVTTVLRRYSSGALGALFSAPTTVALGDGLVDINLRDLNREFVAPATFILAESLWSLIRRSRTRRHLIFDEVGLLYEHEALRHLLVQLARRCRKYDTSLIVATQNAGDLLRSPGGTVVATNPSIALLGGHRGSELAAMETAFNLTTAQRRFLEGAGRGEFLLLAGNRRLSVSVEAPPVYHELLVPHTTNR